MRLDADIIIVGSGVGGATAAKELAKKGKKVLIVEKGPFWPQDKFGHELSAYKFYDKHGLWSKTKEGVFYYRTIMAGGTSIVSCGNAVKSLEKELKKLRINITREFRETSRDLGIRTVPKTHLGKATLKIMQSAHKLGYKMEPMPKLINFRKCVSCGNCILGCRFGAKWTALEYLKESLKKGVSLLTGIEITHILISRGKAIGVEGYNEKGESIEIFASLVILAAGGIGTPIILQNSGIKAGQKLFLDLFTVTFGLTKESGLSKELTMAAVHHNKGFILSPFIDNPVALVAVVPVNLRRDLRMAIHKDYLLGIMVKIKDDCRGKVNKDGSIEKKVTKDDLFKLRKGAEIARKILIEAKVDPETITTTRIRGAHPGGTATIGEVVNKDLETKIKGLFVCDASVLPTAPGLPPIVTIIALAKRLSKFLKERYL